MPIDKYQYVDNGITLVTQTGAFTNVTGVFTSPVSNLMVTPNVSWDGVTNVTKLQVTWDSNAVNYADIYTLIWSDSGGNGATITNLLVPAYDIVNPIASVYTITVIAINGISLVQAAPVTITYAYKVNGDPSTLLPPTSPHIVGTAGLISNDASLKVAWDYDSANDTVVDKLLDYVIEIYDEVPTTVQQTYSTKPLPNKSGSFELGYAEVYQIFTALPRKITWKVYSRDTFGDLSTALTFITENPVPAAQTFSITPLTKAVQITISSVPDNDGMGYNIYSSLTSGGTRTLVYSGLERNVIIPCLENPPVLKYYTIDAYDALGNTGLITSSEQSATALSTFTIPAVSADYIQFNTSYSGLEAVGKLFWDSDNGTLQFGLTGGNVNLQVGQETVVKCFNDSGTNLVDGQIVYISGAQGNRVAIKLAKANSESTSFGTLGMVTEHIASGEEGYVTLVGTVNKLNTLGMAEGALIYLSPTVAGAWTTTKPDAPNHSVVIGYIQRVSATVGSVFVKVEAGYELDELHNVFISSPATGDVLKYNATTGYWYNAANPLSYTAEDAANKVTAWSSPTDVQYPSAKLVNDTFANYLPLSSYHLYYLGKYASLVALQTAHPTASAGDYAQVDTGLGNNVVNYNWDVEDGWVIGSSGSGAANTDALPEGTTNLYFTETRVRSTLLTGFASSAGTVGSSDSILSAFNKIVGNIALKLTANSAITGATKTKITYDANGLVTSGADATTSDISEGSNLYFTETRVRNSVLTGFSALAGTITSSDSILTAFNKLVGNIAAIIRNDIAVTQASHGLSVGNAVYFNGTSYAKAKADASSTLGLFFVTSVTDANNFYITNSGYVTGLSGLTAGQYYYVSNATAGALTATEPTTLAHYSNPLFFALSSTTGYVLSMRPSLVSASFNLFNWLFNGAASAGTYSGWEDEVTDVIYPQGANAPSYKTFFGNFKYYAFAINVMNECQATLHTRHGYKPGGAWHIHVHWTTNGTNTGTCRWGFEYSQAKGHNQDNFPASTTVYVEQAAQGTAYRHMIAETANIASVSIEVDSLTLVRIFRDANHVNDTLSDEAFVLKIDAHYEVDRVATKNKSPNFYT